MQMKVAEDLVVMRRGKERIVFNAEYVNPVYFPQGGDEAIAVLERLRSSAPISSQLQEEACPHELLRFFCDHSLIVSHEESAPATSQKWSMCECEQKSSNRSVYLLLSHFCNQKCIYCLNGRNTYQKQQRIIMPEKIALKAIRTVWESISTQGRLEIVFFGGEPLLNWPLAKTTIDYCEKELRPKAPERKIHYHLTTNLTIFPVDLIEYSRRHGITFLVNVDGPEDIHNATRPFRNGKGSFKTTVKNIRRLIDAGFEVQLRATITKYNHHRMREVAATHKEIGGASCAFVPLNAIDSDESALPIDLCPSPKEYAKGLREVYKSGLWPQQRLFPFNEYSQRLVPGSKSKWGCGAPWGNTPVITAEGKIFSCIYLVGIPAFATGDIFADDFPRRDVLKRMLDITNIDNIARCRQCGFRYLCGGGCPVGRFTIAGNPDTPTAIKRYTEKIACSTSKTVLTELLWSLGRQNWEMSKERHNEKRGE